MASLADQSGLFAAPLDADGIALKTERDRLLELSKKTLEALAKEAGMAGVTRKDKGALAGYLLFRVNRPEWWNDPPEVRNAREEADKVKKRAASAVKKKAKKRRQLDRPSEEDEDEPDAPRTLDDCLEIEELMEEELEDPVDDEAEEEDEDGIEGGEVGAKRKRPAPTADQQDLSRKRIRRAVDTEGKATKTTSNYKGRVAAFRRWVKKNPPTDATCKEGRFTRAQWSNCVNVRNRASPRALEMYLHHRCDKKDWKKGDEKKVGFPTAEGFRSALGWHWGLMMVNTEPGWKVKDNEECKGNPIYDIKFCAYYQVLRKRHRLKAGEETNRALPLLYPDLQRLVALLESQIGEHELRLLDKARIEWQDEDRKAEYMARFLLAYLPLTFYMMCRTDEMKNFKMEQLSLDQPSVKTDKQQWRKGVDPKNPPKCDVLTVVFRKTNQTDVDRAQPYEIHNRHRDETVDTRNLLREWLGYLAEVSPSSEKFQPTDRIFPSCNVSGVPKMHVMMTEAELNRAIQQLVQKSGILVGRFLGGKFSGHCFRRGGAQYRFADCPISRRMDIKTLKLWAGWSTGADGTDSTATMLKYVVEVKARQDNDCRGALNPDLLGYGQCEECEDPERAAARQKKRAEEEKTRMDDWRTTEKEWRTRDETREKAIAEERRDMADERRGWADERRELMEQIERLKEGRPVVNAVRESSESERADALAARREVNEVDRQNRESRVREEAERRESEEAERAARLADMVVEAVQTRLNQSESVSSLSARSARMSEGQVGSAQEPTEKIPEAAPNPASPSELEEDASSLIGNGPTEKSQADHLASATNANVPMIPTANSPADAILQWDTAMPSSQHFVALREWPAVWANDNKSSAVASQRKTTYMGWVWVQLKYPDIPPLVNGNLNPLLLEKFDAEYGKKGVVETNKKITAEKGRWSLEVKAEVEKRSEPTRTKERKLLAQRKKAESEEAARLRDVAKALKKAKKSSEEEGLTVV